LRKEASVNYTLPRNVDTLILFGTSGTGNDDHTGDGLYAANPSVTQTLTGNSLSGTFVVYNTADVVKPRAGSNDIVYAAASYTLPTGVDTLIMEAGTSGTGNSDPAGVALYAADPGLIQTLTGNSLSDTFVVYNTADVVNPRAGGNDVVYAAASYAPPSGVDTLIMEAGASGTGNSDAADTRYGNAGISSMLVAGSGTDTLIATGIAGTVMTGGASANTFAFPN
jgi:hypothetical protein